MPFRTIPISILPVDMTISTGYRSHSYHHSIKHCIEASFQGGMISFHVGFTPSDSERIMVSWLQKEGDRWLYQRTSGEDEAYFQKYEAEAVVGKKFLVCFDSHENRLISVEGSEIKEQIFPSFQKVTNWYAYIDSSSNVNATNPVKISVNLGFTRFTNEMPEGFFPWVYGIDGMVSDKQGHTCFFQFFLFYFVI